MSAGDASASDSEKAIQEAADAVADALDADVIVYNGALDPPADRTVRGLCRSRRRRPNVFLVLVTWGGDPDVAYRIARALQLRYKRFFIYVASYCKSAGTLVALGAHEIVFGEDGELGPLDIQMSKEDSLWETQSGLTVNTAMISLRDRAFLAWENLFLRIEARSGGGITVRTAAEIAADLTTGLFAPLYSQIDPLHVGEAARAMQVADNYGIRLIAGSRNCTYDGLHHLATQYPSHSFVIDSEEAKTIFQNVRSPTDAEIILAQTLQTLAVLPMAPEGSPYISFASSEVAEIAVSGEDVLPQETGNGEDTSVSEEKSGALEAQELGGSDVGADVGTG